MGTLGSLFSRLVCSDCPQDRLWLFASLEISTMETKRFGRSTFTQTCDDANPWLTTCALLQFQTCQSEKWDRKQRKAKPTNNNSKDPFSQTCIANKRRRTTKSHWPKVPPLLLLPPSLLSMPLCLHHYCIIAPLPNLWIATRPAHSFLPNYAPTSLYLPPTCLAPREPKYTFMRLCPPVLWGSLCKHSACRNLWVDVDAALSVLLLHQICVVHLVKTGDTTSWPFLPNHQL